MESPEENEQRQFAEYYQQIQEEDNRMQYWNSFNREIKFRAWDINKKRMLHDIHRLSIDNERIDIICAESLVESYHGNFTYGKNDIILLQFTGIKDMNDNDIYEGQIISCRHIQKTRVWDKQWTTLPGMERRGVVRYHNSYFKIQDVCALDYLPERIKVGSNHACEWEDKYCDFSIIGNIFETPHLINM